MFISFFIYFMNFIYFYLYIIIYVKLKIIDEKLKIKRNPFCLSMSIIHVLVKLFAPKILFIYSHLSCSVNLLLKIDVEPIIMSK